jgi:hypothetical protein
MAQRSDHPGQLITGEFSRHFRENRYDSWHGQFRILFLSAFHFSRIPLISQL